MMNEQHNWEQLQRRMAEASLLAADDPLRIALEAELAGADERALSQWREQTAEGAALREALSDAAPPTGLQQRLLAAKAASVRTAKLRHASAFAAACAAVAVCVAAIVVWRSLESGGTATNPTPIAPPIAQQPRDSATPPSPLPEPTRLLTQRDYQLEFAKSPASRYARYAL